MVGNFGVHSMRKYFIFNPNVVDVVCKYVCRNHLTFLLRQLKPKLLSNRELKTVPSNWCCIVHDLHLVDNAEPHNSDIGIALHKSPLVGPGIAKTKKLCIFGRFALVVHMKSDKFIVSTSEVYQTSFTLLSVFTWLVYLWCSGLFNMK